MGAGTGSLVKDFVALGTRNAQEFLVRHPDVVSCA